jgi:hypothetical protein
MHKPPNLPIASQRPLNGCTDEGGLGGRRQPPNPSYRVWDGLGGRLFTPVVPRPDEFSQVAAACATITRLPAGYRVRYTAKLDAFDNHATELLPTIRGGRWQLSYATPPVVPCVFPGAASAPAESLQRRTAPGATRTTPNPVPRVHGRRMAPQSTSNSRRLLHPSSRLRPVTRTFTPDGILPLRHGARHTNLTFSSPHTSYEWSQQ